MNSHPPIEDSVIAGSPWVLSKNASNEVNKCHSDKKHEKSMATQEIKTKNNKKMNKIAKTNSLNYFCLGLIFVATIMEVIGCCCCKHPSQQIKLRPILLLLTEKIKWNLFRIFFAEIR